MSITYFRPRDPFDFSKDTLDIGNPLSWDRSQFGYNIVVDPSCQSKVTPLS